MLRVNVNLINLKNVTIGNEAPNLVGEEENNFGLHVRQL